jgi:hypothetical protein
MVHKNPKQGEEEKEAIHTERTPISAFNSTRKVFTETLNTQ